MLTLTALKANRRLIFVSGVFVAIFILFDLLAFNTLSLLKVDGPYYNRIVLGKDLIADILPPPEYVIEAYLVAYELADPSNRPFLAGLERKGLELRQDYDERHKYWTNQLTNVNENEGQIKTAMLVASYDFALQFWNTFQNDLVPAVQRNDYSAAAQLLHGPLKRSYEAHRTAIDQVVTLTNTRNSTIETQANGMIAARLTLLSAVGAAILLGVLWGLVRLLRQATREPLQATVTNPTANLHVDNQQAKQPDHVEILTGLIRDLVTQLNSLVRNATSETAQYKEQAGEFNKVAAEIRFLAHENGRLGDRIGTLIDRFQVLPDKDLVPNKL